MKQPVYVCVRCCMHVALSIFGMLFLGILWSTSVQLYSTSEGSKFIHLNTLSRGLLCMFEFCNWMHVTAFKKHLHLYYINSVISLPKCVRM